MESGMRLDRVRRRWRGVEAGGCYGESSHTQEARHKRWAGGEGWTPLTAVWGQLVVQIRSMQKPGCSLAEGGTVLEVTGGHLVVLLTPSHFTGGVEYWNERILWAPFSPSLNLNQRLLDSSEVFQWNIFSLLSFSLSGVRKHRVPPCMKVECIFPCKIHLVLLFASVQNDLHQRM